MTTADFIAGLRRMEAQEQERGATIREQAAAEGVLAEVAAEETAGQVVPTPEALAPGTGDPAMGSEEG